MAEAYLPAGWKASKGGGGGAAVTCPTFDPDQSDLTTISATPSQASRTPAVSATSPRSPASSSSCVRGARPRGTGSSAGAARVPGQLVESSATKGTTIKVNSKGKLPLAVPGKRKSAYRIVATVTSGREQAKVYLDLILQGAGQADTVLIITSVLKAPSPALETKLAKAIAARLPK